MAERDLLARVDRLNLVLPQIVKRFHTLPSRAQPSLSLSIPQLRMLMLLEGEGEFSMGELARRAGVTMPTATASISALARGRYVGRRRSPRDRRVVRVGLRARGRKVLAAFHEQRRERLVALLSGLAPEAQEAFVQAFELIVEILRQLDRGTGAKGEPPPAQVR